MTEEERLAAEAAAAAAKAKDGDGDGKPPGTSKASGKVFTQEELNAIVADRVNREQQKYGDYDALKTQIEAFEKTQREKEDAEKSELQKVTELNEQLAQEKVDLGRQLTNTKLNFAVEREASSLGFVDPSDAFALIDMSAVKIEDGNVEGADEAVKALAKAKPHLLRKKVISDDSGATGTGDKSDDPKRMNDIARRFGLSN